jgi:hypothetical protein
MADPVRGNEGVAEPVGANAYESTAAAIAAAKTVTVTRVRSLVLRQEVTIAQNTT